MLDNILHVYTRVSTQTQQNEGTSLSTQRELGIAKAQDLGFEHKVWNEGGASSHYEDLQNRPVLLGLLSDIKGGKVKHLWVYNNDRLSRNEVTAQTIRMALQKHGVTLYTNNGQFDLNNPHDKLIKTIFDGLAQFDNALRAERTRLGKLNRIREGSWMGGPPPYGYQIVDKKLSIHPEESKWVSKMYHWYEEGKSVQWIKSELDKSGIQTRRMKSLWTLGSIRKILQNTHPKGEYKYNDSKTNEVIMCYCPSIISKTLWNACQEKRRSVFRRRGQNNRTKRFYLLRNLLFCGHCGSPMSGRIKENKNEYLYYCPKKERDWVNSAPTQDEKWKRDTGCTMKRSLNIHKTDNLVKTEVMNLITEGNILAYIKKKHSQNKINKQSSDVSTLRNHTKILNKERKNLIDNIAEVETSKLLGKYDKFVAEKVIENLTNVLKDTEAKIEQTNYKIHHQHNYDNIFENLMKPSSRIDGLIPFDISSHISKSDLESIIEKIEVNYNESDQSHTLNIYFKLPVSNQNDLKIDIKKIKKSSKNQDRTTDPQTKKECDSGIMKRFFKSLH